MMLKIHFRSKNINFMFNRGLNHIKFVKKMRNCMEYCKLFFIFRFYLGSNQYLSNFLSAALRWQQKKIR